MYLDFYNLREAPFELTSNPSYLYLTPRHREALSNLQYGLASAKAVTVLIGEAGTGKTTLIKAALGSDRCSHVRCIFLNNPALTRTEFLEVIARGLGLSADASRSKAVLLEELEINVRDTRARGITTALVVDEAQSMSVDLLEEVRLLANLETPSDKLLPVLLVGQPDLGLRLEEPALRQLKQRVALRCEITPFTLNETAAYIAARIDRAGGSAVRLFTRDAVMRIHEYSSGIPRTINVICDNALLHGLALGRQPVEQEIVHDVGRDFRLGDHALEPSRRAPAPAPAAAAPSAIDQPRSRENRTDNSEPEPADHADPPAAPQKFRLFGSRR